MSRHDSQAVTDRRILHACDYDSQSRPQEEKPSFQYPVNISPATDVKPKIESAVITPDGISAATVIGRFYVWQKLDEHGGLLELQATTQ